MQFNSVDPSNLQFSSLQSGKGCKTANASYNGAPPANSSSPLMNGSPRLSVPLLTKILKQCG